MKKYFLHGFLVIVLVFGITVIGCSGGGGTPTTPTDPTSPDTPATPSSPQAFDNITATQLVANIKIGWNLGNSLDAAHLTWLPANPTVAQMETGWGNPVITKANITAVKNAGFNAIRIPVSWTKAADSNYNIRNDWMVRVTEVVNYAADNGMYIILNTHHDEDVFKFTSAQKTASLAAFKKIWEQIAANFKNYNEKLIFEGLNEPRVIDSPNEWNGGTAEERGIINEYYQVFVDTVRSSGGNNDKRMLMVNTQAASGTATAIDGLSIPTDTVSNRIIVSIHAYEPYAFALAETDNPQSVSTWSSSNSADTSAITGPIDRAYTKFVANGTPVLIGEFGAVVKDNEAARAAWVAYYVNYAKGKNIPCFYWDDGGLFKLLNRSNNSWFFTTFLSAMIGASGD